MTPPFFRARVPAAFWGMVHPPGFPPFSAIPGLGEAAALSLAENRTGRTFISQEELIAACPGLSKSTVEMLRQAGALGTLPETSQISLF